jgi:hypothetical protein
MTRPSPNMTIGAIQDGARLRNGSGGTTRRRRFQRRSPWTNRRVGAAQLSSTRLKRPFPLGEQSRRQFARCDFWHVDIENKYFL